MDVEGIPVEVAQAEELHNRIEGVGRLEGEGALVEEGELLDLVESHQQPIDQKRKQF